MLYSTRSLRSGVELAARVHLLPSFVDGDAEGFGQRFVHRQGVGGEPGFEKRRPIAEHVLFKFASFLYGLEQPVHPGGLPPGQGLKLFRYFPAPSIASRTV